MVKRRHSPMLPVAVLAIGSGLLWLWVLGSGSSSGLTASNVSKKSCNPAYSGIAHLWCPMPIPGVTEAAAAATVTRPPKQYPVTPFPANFWYVKTVKTGSTILAGVFHTICHRNGIQWLNFDLTRLVIGVQQPNLDQLKAVQQKLHNLTDFGFLAITSHMVYNREVADALRPQFLFTVVRHPLQRVLSHYTQAACVHAAKEKGWERQLPHRQQQAVGPNTCLWDAEFRRHALQNDSAKLQWAFANTSQAKDHTFHYIRGDKTTVQDAAAQYNFIFTAERMNEALVLFMLKYGLTVEDIAYLPGQAQQAPDKAPDTPQELANFIMDNNPNDLELWKIANSRLDREKDALQQDCGVNIGKAVAAFEALLEDIQRECSNYQEWYRRHGFEGPYSYTGLPEVAFDSGTGYRCVRHVARRATLLSGNLSSLRVMRAKH